MPWKLHKRERYAAKLEVTWTVPIDLPNVTTQDIASIGKGIPP